jgi:hypothetical protein
VCFFLIIALSGERIESEGWINEAIQKLANMGLIKKELVEAVLTKEVLTRFDLAELVVLILDTTRGKEVPAEALKLIERLTEEFKYELVVIRLEWLEKKQQALMKRLEKNKINGEIEFDFDYYRGELPGEVEKIYGKIPKESKIGGVTKLELFLKGWVFKDISVRLKLTQSGAWGGAFGTPYTGSGFLVEKAYVKLKHKLINLSCGRVEFSFGPFGLLVDNREAQGLDGIVIESNFRNFGLTSILGRITSDYYPQTSIVVGQDNFISARLHGVFKKFLLGINYLYTGLGREQGYGFDIEAEIWGRKLLLEWAWYKPSSDTLIFKDKGWTEPCMVVSGELFRIFKINFTLRYGNISYRFIPYFSNISYYEQELGAPIRGAEGYNLQISRVFKWFGVALEHFYLISKLDRRHYNLSVFRIFTGLPDIISARLEYLRYAKDKITKKAYDKLRLKATFIF